MKKHTLTAAIALSLIAAPVAVDVAQAQQGDLTPDEIQKLKDFISKLYDENNTNNPGVRYFSVNSTGEDNKDNSGATGTNSIAIGPGAQATTNDAVALGTSSKAKGAQSTALGWGAVAETEHSVALGSLLTAKGNESVAIGYGTNTGTSPFNGEPVERAVAIGVSSAADASHALAIGSTASARAVDAIALGHNTVATGEGGVALGSGSKVDRIKGAYRWDPVTDTAFSSQDVEAEKQKIQAQIDEKTKQARELIATRQDDKIREGAQLMKDAQTLRTQMNQLDAKYASNLGIVSVGDESTGKTRQIVSLAAGTKDTDAVNVAQLRRAVKISRDLEKAVGLSAEDIAKINGTDTDKPQTLAARVTNLESTPGVRFVSINSGQSDPTEEAKLGNYNNDGAKDKHSIAIGPNALAEVTGSLAIGSNALSTGYSALAIGTGARANISNGGLATVAVGPNAASALQGATALGSRALSSGLGAIAIGEDAETRSSSAVTVGHNSKTDLTSGVSVGGMINNYGRGAIAMGGFANVFGGYSIAQGYNAFAGKYITKAEYDKLSEEQKTSWMKDNDFILYQALGLDPSTDYYLNKDVNSAVGAVAIGASTRVLNRGIAVGFASKAGDLSVAIGNSANAGTTLQGNTLLGASTVAGNNANKVTALGNGAAVATEGGVALGSNTLSIYGTTPANSIGYSPEKGDQYAKTTEDLMGAMGVADQKKELDAQIATLQAKVDDYNAKYEEALREYKDAVALQNRYQQEYEESDRDRGILRTTLDVSTPEKLAEAREKIKAADEKNSANDKKLKEQKQVVAQKRAEAQKAVAQLTSVQKEQQQLTGKKLALAKLTNAWMPTTGEVAVGNPNTGATRQITGLAAGTRDTDAVNVAQLKQMVELNKKLQAATGIEDDTIAGIAAGGPSAPQSLQAQINELKANSGSGSADWFNSNGESGKIWNRPSTQEGSYGTLKPKQDPDRPLNQNADNTGAVGIGAIAVGRWAKAHSQAGIAMGINSSSYGEGAIAIGSGEINGGAVEEGARAVMKGSVSIGHRAVADGRSYSRDGQAAHQRSTYEIEYSSAVAVGNKTKALGNSSVSIGADSLASGPQSLTLGSANYAGGMSIALGNDSSALSFVDLRHLGHRDTSVSGLLDIDPRFFTNRVFHGSEPSSNVAIGNDARAWGKSNVAIGWSAYSFGDKGTAVGQDAFSYVDGGVAVGASSQANREANQAAYMPIAGDVIQGYEAQVKALGLDEAQFGTLHQAYQQAKTARDQAKAEYEAKLEASETAYDNYKKSTATEKEGTPNPLAKVYSDASDEEMQAFAAYRNANAEYNAAERALEAFVAGGAYSSELGAASVGSARRQRQITNLAAGSNDTDAVNVAQLKQSVKLTKDLQAATGLTDDEIKQIANSDPNAPKTLKAQIEELASQPGVRYLSVNKQKLDDETREESARGNYKNDGATASGAIAIGIDAAATGKNVIALGTKASAHGADSIVIGNTASGVGDTGISIGKEAYFMGPDGVALGNQALAGRTSTALGASAKASGGGGVALGTKAVAGGDSSYYRSWHRHAGNIAIGQEASALDQMSTSIGFRAKATDYAMALGAHTSASGFNNIALGNYSKVTGNEAITQLAYNVYGDDLDALAKAAGVEKSKIEPLFQKVEQTKAAYEAEYKAMLQLEKDNPVGGKPEYGAQKEKYEQAFVAFRDAQRALSEATNNAWMPSAGTVSVGWNEANMARRISNVAAGALDNDAVNVAQLKGAVKLTKDLQTATGLTDEEIKDIVGRTGDSPKNLKERIEALEGQGGTTVVYTKDDGTRVKKANDGLYYPADKVGKDGAALPDAGAGIEASNVVLTLVDGNDSTTTPLRLANVADGHDATDAVNKGQLDEAIDGLAEGIELLHDGEAGTAVYTDEEGNRLKKVGDDYYKVTDLNREGQPNPGAKAVEAGKIKLSLVEKGGDTKTATVLGNLADGVAETDAVNLRQAKKLAEDQIKANDDLYSDGPVGPDGQPTRVVKGLTFAASDATDAGAGKFTKKLGETVNIIGRQLKPGEEQDFSAQNVTTSADTDSILIKFSDKPKFKEVTVVTDPTQPGTGAKTTITPGSVKTEDTGKSAELKPEGTVVTGTNGTTTYGDGAVKVEKDGDSATYTFGKDGTITVDKAGSAPGSDTVAMKGDLEALKTNANAATDKLNKGEAGVVVYTDEAGERVYKANDGEYYKELETDGSGKAGTKVEKEKVKLSVVNVDGTAKKPTVLGNVANGVSANDAVNKGQLDAAVAGATQQDNNLYEGTTGARTLKKITFGADTGSVQKTLGETVNIKGGTAPTGDFSATNVATEANGDTITVKFSDKPTFKQVTVADGAKGTTTIAPNSVKTEKDGKNTEQTNAGVTVTDGGKTNTVTATGTTVTEGGKTNTITVDGATVTDGTNTAKYGPEGVEMKNGAQTTTLNKDGLKVVDGGDSATYTFGKDGTISVNTTGTAQKSDKVAMKSDLDALSGGATSAIDDLKQGRAGTVVYTDKAGNKLIKHTDGKYYTEAVYNNGQPTGQGVDASDVYLSAVNADGTTTNGQKLRNIAAGTEDTDAVNVAQMNEALKKNQDAGKGNDDLYEGQDNNRTLKKITFGGNTGTVAKTLGDTFNIKGGANNGTDFSGTNLFTEVDNLTGDLLVKMSDKPKFKEVTIEDAPNGAKTTLTPGSVKTENAGKSAELTPTGTEVKDADGSTTYGRDGIGVKGNDGKSAELKLDKEGNLTIDTKPGTGTDPQTPDTAKVLTDKNANELLKGLKGDDGAPGTAGAQGPKGQDGQNGKTIFEQIGALRNGESGTVVYTDGEGNRVVLAKDGQYYKANEVDPDGNGTGTPVDANKVKLSLVATDGTTTTPKTLGNVAAGEKDTDAVNVRQAKELADAQLKANTDLYEDTTPAGGGEAQRTLKKLTFAGDVNSGEYKKTLGETVKVLGNGATSKTDYAKDNLLTENTADGIQLLFKEKPTFKGVTLADGGKTVVLTPETDGNLGVAGANGTDGKTVIGKDGISITGPQGNDGAPGKTITIGVDGQGNATLTNDGGAPATIVTQPELVTVVKEAQKTGSVVAYTDAQGGRLVKVGEKFYPEAKVKADGTLTDDAAAAEVPAANVEVRIVNPDGKTTTATKLNNLADGTTDTDAATVGQLKKTANRIDNPVVYVNAQGQELTRANDGQYYLATEVDADGKVKDTNSGAQQPANLKLKGTKAQTLGNVANAVADGDAVNLAQAKTIASDAVKANNDLYEGADNNRSLKKITFGGNTGTFSKTLGDTVNIKGGTTATTDFSDANVATEAAGDTVTIKFSDKPTFKAVTVTDGAKGTTTIEPGTVKTEKDNKSTEQTNAGVTVTDGNKTNTVTATGTTIADGQKTNTVTVDGMAVTDGTDTTTYGKDGINATANDGSAGTQYAFGKDGTITVTKQNATPDTVAMKSDLDKVSGGASAATDALEKGENGVVVYTDKDGKVLKKANDGKYYEQVTNGTGVGTPVEPEDVYLSVVKAGSKSTTDAQKLRNVAAGEAATDAVNKGQLDAAIAGATQGDSNLYEEDSAPGAGQPGAKRLKGITFKGNSGEKRITLGDSFSIKGGTVPTADFSTTNVSTEVDNGTGDLLVKMSDKPKFKEVSIVNDLTNPTGSKTTLTPGSVKAEDGAGKSAELKPGGMVVTGDNGTTTYGDGAVKVGDNTSTSTYTFGKDGTISVEKPTADGTPGTTTTSVVTKDQLDALIGKPGQDGAPGTAGTQGPKGQDGQKGKDLTSQITALRDGEAGTVVYTDEEGNRVYRDKNGNFNTAVDKDGNGTGTPVDAAKVKLSLVNHDGATTTPTKLSNVANAEKDTDAVNLGQMNKALKENKDAGKGNDDLYTDGEVAPDGTATRTLKGITFAGNGATQNAGSFTKTLGERVNIIGREVQPTEEGDFSSRNVTTSADQDTVLIKLSDKPIYKEVTVVADPAQPNTGAKTTLTPGSVKAEDAGKSAELKPEGTVVTGANGTTTYGDGAVKVADGNDTAIYTFGKDGSISVSTTGTKPVNDTVAMKSELDALSGGANEGIEALNEGLAGTVVYTDDQGNRVMKVNNAYYKITDLEADGSPKATATPVENDKVKLSLVEKDGHTTTPTVLGNVADAVAEKDAVNLGQAKKIAEDAVKANTDLYEEDPTTGGTGQAKRTLKKLSFVGDKKTGDYKKTLGDEVKILGNGNANTTGFAKTNLLTENTANGIQLLFAEKPTFKGATIKGDDDKPVTTLEPGSVKVEDNNGDSSELKPTGTTVTGATGTTTYGNGAVTVEGPQGPNGAAGDKATYTFGNDGTITVGKDGKDGAPGTTTTVVTKAELEGLIGKPGDPGAPGTPGAQGPKGQDGLNGKDLSTQITALRDGEAGTVVYTDEEGNRVHRAKDGKFYKSVDDQGVGTDEVDAGKVRLSLVDQDGATTKPEKLGNVAAGTAENDAVNFGQLKGATDRIEKIETGAAGPVVYTDKDGNRLLKATDGEFYKELEKDGTGKTGTKVEKDQVQLRAVNANGTTTAPAKLSNIAAGTEDNDAVNVSQLNAVISNLEEMSDGEIGTVVYTDDEGNRVKRVGDDYYKFTDLDENGAPKQGTTPVDATKIKLSLVEKDGATAQPTKLGNVADGTADTDAVNFGQLKEGTKLDANLYDTEADGSKTFKKISFTGDVNTGEYKKTLGEEVKVKGNGQTNKADFVAKNLLTENTTDGIQLLFAEKPEFKGVNLVDGGKTVVLTPESNGNLGVAGTNGADGKTVIGKDGVSITGPAGADGTPGTPGKTITIGVDGQGNATLTQDGKPAATIVTEPQLTTVVNEAQKAGSVVVYTDKAGNRLAKTKDGKFYPEAKVKADGTVDANVPGDEVAAGDVEVRIVNPDGTATNKTKLNNLADGTADSDAATVGQLNKALKENKEVGKGNDDLYEDDNANMVDGKPGRKLKGITFGGDRGTFTKTLGDRVNIKGATAVNVADFSTTNVTTEAAGDTVTIKFSDKPAFKEVTVAADPTNPQAPKTTVTPEGTTVTGKDGSNTSYGNGGVTVTGPTPANGGVAPNATYTFGQDGNITINTTNPDGTQTSHNVATSGDMSTANEHIAALERGEAGPVVYTDEEGNRVVEFDGQFYKVVDMDPTTEKPAANAKAVDADKVVLSLVQAGSEDTKTPTKLRNVADGTDDNDAVNLSQLTKVANRIDSPVVYVNAQGEELTRANDGKLYKAADVDDQGNLKSPNSGEQTAAGQKLKGATPAKLGNVADGTDDNDAVNVKQLKDAVKEAANSADAGKGNDDLYEDKTNEDGAVVNEAGQGLVRGDDGKWYLDNGNGQPDKGQGEQTPARKVKGLTFEGNSGSVRKTLGETLKVLGNTSVAAADRGNYSTTNVLTEVDANGDLLVKMSDKPLFKEVSVVADPTNPQAPKTTLTPGSVTVEDAAGNNTALAPEGTTVMGKDGSTTTYGNGGITVATPGTGGTAGTSATYTFGDDGNITINTGGKTDTVATSSQLGAANEKVSTLEKGEAGPLVYTDDKGNRVIKAKDGKYYLAGQVNADGSVKAGSQAIDMAKVKLSLVSTDGSTNGTAPSVLGNVAEGSADTDAVNVKQLKTVEKLQQTLQNDINNLTKISGAGWSLEAGGKKTNVTPTQGLEVKGDENILVSVDARATGNQVLNVKLADDLKVKGSVTVGENGPVLTGQGLDMKGKPITGVGQGTTPDSVVTVGGMEELLSGSAQLGQMRATMNQGDANNAALGALQPLGYDELHPTSFAFGMGYAGGQTALALGLTHYFNPDRAVNLGASVGGDRVHFRLGAAFRMGDRNDEKVINTPRTQDARLISKLQEENKAQDELIRELQRQIDELKESIKK